MGFEWIVFFGLTIWLYWKWMKHTRIERQRKKFDNLRKEFVRSSIDTRNVEVKNLQRKNMFELAELVNELLDKHHKDITPRQLDEIKKSIQSYIDNLKFDKLHDLYNILSKSNRNNVYDNLKNFRR
jgi:polyribonucleotide nucleotidyltransferase